MLLTGAHVTNFRSVEDSDEFTIEPDVTCLVGKNESGKTATLQAIYRLNPVEPSKIFNEVIDFPARLTKQRKGWKDTEQVPVVKLRFRVTDSEIAQIEKDLGTGVLASPEFMVIRGYRDDNLGGSRRDRAVAEHGKRSVVKGAHGVDASRPKDEAADRCLDPARVQATLALGFEQVGEDVEVDHVARALEQKGVFADEQGLGHLDAHGVQQRERLVGEFAMFLRQMRQNDIVLTTRGGRFYVGVIDGPPVFVDSSDRRSNLRRPVHWLTPNNPFDLLDLAPPLPTLVQSQDDVIDLTNALPSVDKLLDQIDADQRISLEPGSSVVAVAGLAPVTQALADQLLTNKAWLDEVVELLRQRQQLIFYGPPGTGKTYLASKLAGHLTEPHAATLVQFHPSYTYEDFFEGFRPEPTEDGSLRFRLRPGPFRRLADDAREHPGTPYILIIDEINRGNLAKIFGEMYFLLEYRDQRISLQYSQEGDFTLPRNLYVVGTMNTADRSIALVDAAMRRRFAFVELHPAKPPVDGLLRRWLKRQGYYQEPAKLLDLLNERLADADYAIGPSYLMRDEIYDRPDEGLERVWRHDILPLLVEHHYADRIDVAERYGLDSLRASLP